MKGKLPTMKVAIKELEKNRWLKYNHTYLCLIRGGIFTEDIWFSKLKNITVYAVMFTHGKKMLGIWDASIGELRPAGNPNIKDHYMSDELYIKFNNT